MAEPARRDPKAPRFLEITVTGSDGNVWGKTIALAKDFKTGSVGFYGSEKITNPESSEKYQCGFSFTLIGSKPSQ
jgi:hypothetical protein